MSIIKRLGGSSAAKVENLFLSAKYLTRNMRQGLMLCWGVLAQVKVNIYSNTVKKKTKKNPRELHSQRGGTIILIMKNRRTIFSVTGRPSSV